LLNPDRASSPTPRCCPFAPQAFSAILFKIYPQLFVAILAYATVGTLVTTSVGKRLVGLNFLQLQREAFFRYSLMRVRENSESIAFYGGEPLEMKEIGRRLQVRPWSTEVSRAEKEKGVKRNAKSATYLVQRIVAGLGD
jgi:hypothetical protein